MNLREAKHIIRAYMQSDYTDQNLADALCHARDEKLCYASCCCFAGIPTADHPLRSFNANYGSEPHYQKAVEHVRASYAGMAYSTLGNIREGMDDALARRRIIPMLRAEMRRRDYDLFNDVMQSYFEDEREQMLLVRQAAMDLPLEDVT